MAWLVFPEFSRVSVGIFGGFNGPKPYKPQIRLGDLLEAGIRVVGGFCLSGLWLSGFADLRYSD